MGELVRPASADRLEAVKDFCLALGLDPGDVVEMHIDTRQIEVRRRHPSDRRFEVTDVLELR